MYNFFLYGVPKFCTTSCFRLQLHGAIYRPDSFVLMVRYCANLKAIRYESMSLNRIADDKSHRVIVALYGLLCRMMVKARDNARSSLDECPTQCQLSKICKNTES